MTRQDRTKLFEAARNVFVAQVTAAVSLEIGGVKTAWAQLEAIAGSLGVDTNGVWESVRAKLARTDPYASMVRAGY